MSRHEEDEDERYYVIEEKGGGGLGSFMLGAVIGAGIALLLAPQSGEETRADIRRQASEMKDAAKDVAGDLSDTVADGYSKAKRTVGGKLDSAKQAIDIKKHQATEAIRAGREAAAQARQELEARLAETKAAYQAGADVSRGSRRAGPGEDHPGQAREDRGGDPGYEGGAGGSAPAGLRVAVAVNANDPGCAGLVCARQKWGRRSCWNATRCGWRRVIVSAARSWARMTSISWSPAR